MSIGKICSYDTMISVTFYRKKRLKSLRWVELNQQIDSLLAQSSQLRFWRDCLWDAVELVDWRSSKIRDRAINHWLAEETLKGMNQLPHPRIQKLVERLEAQFPEMLTFLDGIVQPP